MNRLRHIITLAIALSSMVAAAQHVRHTKIPLWLSIQMESMSAEEPIHLVLAGNPLEVKHDVESHGGTFKYAVNQMSAVVVPASAIALLDQAESIQSMHIESGHGSALLEMSMLNTRIEHLHSATDRGHLMDLTGEGVIVGVIDAGIDFNHPDFMNPDSTTRVLEIWDQTMPYSAERTPSYGYGQIWTAHDIDVDSCPHTDQSSYYGHGTNTAGIATGNGFAVNNFKGAAPDADIVVVSSNFNAVGWTSTVADAVNYIFNKADALGKPCVINASIGSYYGSHDGNDAATEIIESLIEESNGRIMVCAAGNAGEEDPFHLGYECSSDTGFTWFEVPASATIGNGYIYFEAFGDRNEFERVQFAVGADQVSPSHKFRGATAFDSVLNRLYQTYTDTLWSLSGNYLGQVQTWADSINGTYRLQVYASLIDSIDYNFRFSTTGSGRIDIWSGSLTASNKMLVNELPTMEQFPPIANYRYPDDLQTIVSNWACSESVVTVGNFTNRTSYTDVDENTVVFSSLTAGALAASSSSGPTRKALVKPDIAAPGQLTIAPGAAFQISTQLAISTQRERVAIGGMHQRAGGTSSASPVVAGLAALFLQACPEGSYSDFLEAVQAGAVEDEYTGTVPNNSWGYGKVDGLNTINYSRPSVHIVTDGSSFCEGDELVLSLSDPSSTIIWSNGSTSPTIRLNESGAVHATLTNNIGCSANTDTLLVQKHPLPVEPIITLNKSLPACLGEPLIASVPEGFGSYYWTNGSFARSIEITEPGAYSCTVMNEHGCERSSEELEISFHENRTIPELQRNASDLLFAVHDSFDVAGYNWFWNEELVPGATDSSLQVLNPGVYQVEVLETNGCSWFSNELWISTLGINNISDEVMLYPQPVDNVLMIQGISKNTSYRLFDVQGRIAQAGVISPMQQLNLTHLNAGFYVLEIDHADGSTHRVVKL